MKLTSDTASQLASLPQIDLDPEEKRAVIRYYAENLYDMSLKKPAERLLFDDPTIGIGEAFQRAQMREKLANHPAASTTGSAKNEPSVEEDETGKTETRHMPIFDDASIETSSVDGMTMLSHLPAVYYGTGGMPNHPRYKHEADTLKAHPNQWGVVAMFDTIEQASVLSSAIRRSHYAAFRGARWFSVHTQLKHKGWAVIAKYIGEIKEGDQ